MKEIKIDLLTALPLGENQEKLLKRSSHKKFPKSIAIFIAILLVLSSTAVYSYQKSLDEDSRLNQTLKIFSGIGHFVVNPDQSLKGEKEDRINILLLGIGGDEHEGGELTDTIIVVSIQPSTKKVAMMSIPRDLLVNIKGHGWRKINNANAFGEYASPGSGPQLAVDTISSLINQPIHYYAKVDFSAFKEIIDTLGGVNVIVDNSFTDYQYPTLNKKYQVVSFEAGPQNMDGVTALQYVRSRHSGMNNEGSDFARSKRQQKVILAVKDKMLSANFLLNPKKINEILDSLQTHIKTDMEVWEILKFATMSKDINTGSISNLVLDDGPGGYLYSGMVDGAYVLQIRGDNPQPIQEAFLHLLDQSNSGTATDNSAPRLNAAPIAIKAKVAVKNGTLIEGLASRSAQRLKFDGFEIVSTSNAKERDLLRSKIYDLSGQHTQEAREIANKFGGDVITEAYYEPTDETISNADILIILGDTTNR